MPLRFSLREHKNYAAWDPVITFSKLDATTLRMTTSTLALGDGYFFIVANRVWLNGKYIRFRWRSNIPSTLTAYVYLYDGEYVRSSDVDFPSGSGIPAKGNGLLQTLSSKSAPFGWETLDVQANIGGGSETLCTLFFKLHDNQSGSSAYLDLDWVEFNLGAGGSGTFADEQFTDSITMERTGTIGDYGYISAGILPDKEVGSVDLSASFEVGQDSQDLPASFEVGQDSADFLQKIVIRHSDNKEILGKFTPRRSDSKEIPCETIIRNVGSGDILIRFEVGQDSVGLYGGTEIRQETSIDLSAGFTVTHWKDLLGKFTVRQSFPSPLDATGYRKKLTITGSVDGALEDYPIGIKVYYGAGVDGTESGKAVTLGKVYCDSKCRTDFGDLRFFANNFITELDYWMEEKTDGVSAIFWVKIPQIPQSPLTVDIYVNYGDAKQIITTSDGDATFHVFDHFDGSSLDVSKWDENLNGNLRLIEDSYLKVTINAGASYNINSTLAHDFSDNVEIMCLIDMKSLTASTQLLNVAPGRALDRNAVLASWGGGWYKEGDYDRRVYGIAASWWPGANRGAATGVSRHAIASVRDDYLRWFCEGVKNFGPEQRNVNNNFPIGADRYVRWLLNSINGIQSWLDWIAVRPRSPTEPLPTSWGAEEELLLGDLLASFHVGQDSQDLPATFEVGQDSQDLPGKVAIRHPNSVDLLAKAAIRQDVSVDLFAKMEVMHWRDLFCVFCIPYRYNFSDGMGIAFHWWGSGGMDQNVDFEVWSPTGGWIGSFPDGPARWRQVTLSWDDLTEVDLDGSRPSKSNITGMYWTYHTPGVRRVDAIQTWMMQDLLCRFIVRNMTGQELLARFEVGQGFKDLSAKFFVVGVEDVIDIYTAEQDASIDSPASWGVAGNLSITIPSVSVGDKIVATYDGQINIGGQGYSIRMRAAGGPIGLTIVRSQNPANREVTSFTRTYEAVGSGSLDIDVQWDTQFATDCQMMDATLTVQHIH